MTRLEADKTTGDAVELHEVDERDLPRDRECTNRVTDISIETASCGRRFGAIIELNYDLIT